MVARPGRSFIERGASRLPAGLQQPARLFAAIGYAPTAVFVGFFGPWMVVAETADVVAPVPSYLGFGQSVQASAVQVGVRMVGIRG